MSRTNPKPENRIARGGASDRDAGMTTAEYDANHAPASYEIDHGDYHSALTLRHHSGVEVRVTRVAPEAMQRMTGRERTETHYAAEVHRDGVVVDELARGASKHAIIHEAVAWTRTHVQGLNDGEREVQR
jgi:hypothetical protein